MQLNDQEDLQLMALLKKGNERAFTEIYNRYWEKLLGIAYKHTKDKSASEEILQEVFLSLWNRREIVEIQTLQGYLATAVKFSIFKKHQRQRRRLELEQTAYKVQLISEDEHEIDARFLQEYINGIVEQLPEKCQLVFRYSREAGLNIPEIAEEMNIAEKTVESHLTKALKTIRLNLKGSDLLAVICSISLFK